MKNPALSSKWLYKTLHAGGIRGWLYRDIHGDYKDEGISWKPNMYKFNHIERYSLGVICILKLNYLLLQNAQ